ncbi:hypothetical protein H5410_027704 [Solanum commersonii]|uniref:Uncharacterized protein n=1 Tax=Solanum commersonii TaxID=4109 RepID=A0A9J5Z440_SOLCO|nr:hypothetical protein H5410_027704 [Solanum commersonii]
MRHCASGAFGGITAVRCDTLVGQIHSLQTMARGMGRYSTFGHPEGDINFCGQVLPFLVCRCHTKAIIKSAWGRRSCSGIGSK